MPVKPVILSEELLNELGVEADENNMEIEKSTALVASPEVTRLKKKRKLESLVEKMKTQLSERGIVTQNTSVNSDQIKSQLPIFTGDCSLSILDAKHTWQRIIKNICNMRQQCIKAYIK